MESLNISIELLPLLFLTGCIAGFLDTLAGGGGLITLPALIVSGIPPLSALGTNKLQGTIGTATAAYVMFRKRRVRLEEVKQLMFAAFIGSTLGTVAVQFINTDVLHFIIPGVLLFTALYFLIAPLPQNASGIKKISAGTYQKMVVPGIGWYDGMFGPGTGSFFALAGVSLRGQGLIDATAWAKTFNFSTNFASLLIFLLAGKVAWIIGLVMMLGQFIGAWTGSLYLLKIHPKYLRIIIVVMCLAMLSRYLYSTFLGT